VEVPDVAKKYSLHLQRYSSARRILLALLYLEDEHTNPVTQQHNQVL
jgi:hypothetical protein